MSQRDITYNIDFHKRSFFMSKISNISSELVIAEAFFLFRLIYIRYSTPQCSSRDSLSTF